MWLRSGLSIRKPLNQVLRSSPKATIYILSDYQPVRNPNSKFISQALYWLGSMIIIGGFLWAEVKIASYRRIGLILHGFTRAPL
jgi:hypothetical protein